MLSPPSAKVWVLFTAMWLVPQLGITVGYHGMETHNGFKAHPWVRAALLVSGAMAVQGEVSGWVLNHRVHHRFQDQPGLDPHSPLEYPGFRGLLWAHIGWLHFRFERPVQYCTSVRLEADALVRWQRRWFVALVVASFAIPFALAGWSGLLVAGFLRVVFVLHITWSVNSVCHQWGSRAKDSAGNTCAADDSRNNVVVEVLGLGEGYHANHHAQPTWAFHGWSRQLRPVQVGDPAARDPRPGLGGTPARPRRRLQVLPTGRPQAGGVAPAAVSSRSTRVLAARRPASASRPPTGSPTSASPPRSAAATMMPASPNTTRRRTRALDPKVSTGFR